MPFLEVLALLRWFGDLLASHFGVTLTRPQLVESMRVNGVLGRARARE